MYLKVYIRESGREGGTAGLRGVKLRHTLFNQWVIGADN